MRLFSALLLALFIGCGKQVTTTSSSLDSSKILANCPAGAHDPDSIDELVVMINSLPKPMTADCFLKSLKRPLYVNASSSTMSVQPADGDKNPRIFIFKGNLILTLVPNGEGSLVLEFSELKNDVRSFKGEVVLPVTKTLAPADPYVRTINGSQTTCKGCHASEQPEFKIGNVQIYSSKALKPSPGMDVPLSNLSYELYLCDFKKDYSKRCDFYRALLNFGEVHPINFPADMPTLLDSF